MDYAVLKGTHDVIREEADAYSSIEAMLCQIAALYGFKEYRTPIIEGSSLFLRSVGESSDIVRKEMYTFKDKGDRDISLRPEMTAGTIRAMVNSKIFSMQDFPVKAFYLGPNFRYERPQQGRYRQFNQFGVESVGGASYLRDAEVILLGYNSLKLLGFTNLTLKINTLGDDETRKAYKKELVSYFSKHIDGMCSDCKERLEINPLRILDCKVPEDQEIVKGAPKLKDYLSKDAKELFTNLLSTLDDLKIPYVIDDNLVRGLDYYSGVVFEFSYVSSKGLDYGALGGGGHYNHLVNEIGGPDLQGVGFAFGIDRLYNVLKDDGKLPESQALDIYIMPLDSNLYLKGLELANSLRNDGFSTEINLEGSSLPTAFKKAERRGAKIALIFGEDEIKNGTIQVKNLIEKKQNEIKIENLVDTLDEIFVEEEH
jgi:histidyl-tRNA synthetase